MEEQHIAHLREVFYRIRQFWLNWFREWTPEGEGEHGAPETGGHDQVSEEGCSSEERPIDMEEIDQIINNRPLQIIWKTKMAGLKKVDYATYNRCKINTT